MRIRLARNWDWRVPGKRAVVAFPAGDWVMTRTQGDAAISEGVGSEIPSGAENKPRGARRAAKSKTD